MCATERRPVNPTPTRLSDADILEIVDAAYEAAVWYADLGMVDFDPFAELAAVLREMRLRVRPEGGAA